MILQRRESFCVNRNLRFFTFPRESHQIIVHYCEIVCAIVASKPLSLLISESNVPNSAFSPSPFLITNIMSQLLNVSNRQALVITVHLFNFSCTVFQMVCSVIGSTWAVGSSKITILLSCNKVRAKQTSCLFPTL